VHGYIEWLRPAILLLKKELSPQLGCRRSELFQIGRPAIAKPTLSP
jgi:hypothetical protein